MKKTDDILLKRLLLSVGILLFIRMGTFLPIPGINHGHLAFYIQQHPITKNLVSTFSGNDTFVIGLFTLNIFPYINASIMVQLITGLIPSISKLQKEGGGEGRRAITRLTRLITFGWALIQSSSIAFYLKRALFDWSPLLAFEIILWLTTGAMIVLWLSELITEYGLGNGASLLIYTNIISSLPNLGKKLITENTGNFNLVSGLGIGLLFFIAISGIITLQESARIVPLISSKQLGQSQSLSSKVKSNNYMEVQSGPKYSIPFLNDESSSVSYNLVVSFPDKQQYVLSSIIGVATLSFMLTLIVVVIATSALYQIIQQKKLSEIKNDFINNISHEFKTPIATINLALDAISSSTKNLNDKSISYLGMIREENSRMLSQVENILRISQLEKSSNPFDMEQIDIH